MPARETQSNEVTVTITPEDTLRAALTERPEGVTEQRWSNYNRRFIALLMGRDRELPEYARPVEREPHRPLLQQPPPSLPVPRRRRIEWAEVRVVLVVALGALAVDLAVAMSLGAPLGIMGVALVGRGLVVLGEV